MLLRDHPALSPPHGNCTVWRYMDFTKFLSLLETQALHLARADQFEDPYEGAWSRAGVEAMRKHDDKRPVGMLDVLIGLAHRHRTEMYLSCWHMSEHESAAMWRLYLQSNEGVAIRSDYQTLAAIAEASPFNVGASVVRYVDYDKYPIAFGNGYWPFVHKRLSFAHERELRLILWRPIHQDSPPHEVDEKVVAVGARVEQLVHGVHVAPTSPAWFGDLVQRVCERYGLSIQVVRSSLYDRPTY